MIGARGKDNHSKGWLYMSVCQMIINAKPIVFADDKFINLISVPVNKRQSDIEPVAL